MFGVLFAQGVVVAGGALAGLLIVRALPPEDYAGYALAFAVLGALNLLGDSGTTTAAMAAGGPAWQDPRKLGAVLAEARRLRARLAWGFGVPGLVVLGAGLWRIGLAPTGIAAWCAVVAVLFSLNVRAPLLDVPLKLHQALRVTQGVAVGQVVLRLGLVALMVLCWPVATLVALANGLPQAWTNFRLARAGRALTANDAEPVDAATAGAMRGVVRRSLPGGIYYILCQQAGFAILGFMGSTLELAQLGALARIGLLIGLVTALANAVMVPRFARLSAEANLSGAYWRNVALAVALCVPVAAVGLVWPSALLWLVGPSYSGLEFALRLAVAGAALQVVGAVCMQLVHARGWLPPPWLAIACSLAVQLGSWWLLDLRTLAGILGMMLALGVQQIVLHSAYFEYRMKKTKN